MFGKIAFGTLRTIGNLALLIMLATVWIVVFPINRLSRLFRALELRVVYKGDKDARDRAEYYNR